MQLDINEENELRASVVIPARNAARTLPATAPRWAVPGRSVDAT